MRCAGQFSDVSEKICANLRWTNDLTAVLFLGHPPEEYVISSHHVNSWFECSEICLDNEDCVTFSHRITSSDDINCKVASESAEEVVCSPQHTDKWTTYEKAEPVSYNNCAILQNLGFVLIEHIEVV